MMCVRQDELRILQQNVPAAAAPRASVHDIAMGWNSNSSEARPFRYQLKP